MISSYRSWLLAGLFSLCTFNIHSADWPQWRGPERTGYVPSGVPVPKTLPAEAKVVWRMKIGEGLASPIVAGGKVFYTDNTEAKETIHGADAATGKILWSTPIDDPFKDSQGPFGPRCTPVTDGERVYAQSCRGELQCVSATDGKLIWRVNYSKDFGAIFSGEKGQAAGASRHGNDGSPILDGPNLIALVGSTNGAGVVCFNKATGAVVWKSLNDPAAYAPPIVATIAGVKQSVCFLADGVLGLDTRTGKLLWRVLLKTALARHVITPVVVDDTVYVASHQIGLIAVKISRTADGLEATKQWASKEAAFNFASPVAVGQHLYGVGPSKNLVCADAKTGQLAWSKEAFFTTDGSKAFASFLVMDKNILVLTDSGQLVLLAAAPGAYQEISRLQVCGVNWCNPAYADGKLYLRDARELICLDLLP